MSWISFFRLQWNIYVRCYNGSAFQSNQLDLIRKRLPKLSSPWKRQSSTLSNMAIPNAPVMSPSQLDRFLLEGSKLRLKIAGSLIILLLTSNLLIEMLQLNIERLEDMEFISFFRLWMRLRMNAKESLIFYT